MAAPRTPAVPVSWGELLDKITILEIKRERIARTDALANVAREHRLLRAIAAPALRDGAVAVVFAQLKTVNEDLWEIEDAIRRLDAERKFGREFVALAQSVYRKNDERASLKRRINRMLLSELVEEKSYPAFGREAGIPDRKRSKSAAGATQQARSKPMGAVVHGPNQPSLKQKVSRSRPPAGVEDLQSLGTIIVPRP
jgi:hypothetical protein